MLFSSLAQSRVASTPRVRRRVKRRRSGYPNIPRSLFRASDPSALTSTLTKMAQRGASPGVMKISAIMNSADSERQAEHQKRKNAATGFLWPLKIQPCQD